ncbi:hypothetical protein [Altererythrobacter sp. MF3-039]|uniref:hypothetical protein n=1 Tax=Altererythrobacter sp. MF3-039 TaxID=3252901 RepID=UPI00390C71C5
MTRNLIVISSMALLAACSDIADGMSEGFEEGLAEEIAASCNTELAEVGIAAEVVAQTCECVAKRSASELSIGEMLEEGSGKIEAISEECLNEAMDKMGETQEPATQSDPTLEEN